MLGSAGTQIKRKNKMRISKWTDEDVSDLELVAKQFTNADGRIAWEQGVFATPEGKALLKRHDKKACLNKYMNIGFKRARQLRAATNRSEPQVTHSEPAPAEPRRTSDSIAWTEEEVKLLHELGSRFGKGNGMINWKRAQAEAPDVVNTLTLIRSLQLVKSKWYYIQAQQKKADRKKSRAVAASSPVVETERTEPDDGLAPRYCYSCGAPLVVLFKGLEIYRKIR